MIKLDAKLNVRKVVDKFEELHTAAVKNGEPEDALGDIMHAISLGFGLLELERAAKLSFADRDQTLAHLKDIRESVFGYYITSEASKIMTVIGMNATNVQLANLQTSAEARRLKNGRVGEPMEIDIETEFYKNLENYIPGAKKIAVPIVRGGIPDGFISVNGKAHAVEVKRKRFGRSALGQLVGYLVLYNLDSGIAVAPELDCVLPKNVRFVKVGAHSLA